MTGCTVCGRSAMTGHEHTSLPLCGDHAAWWTEALTERTDASCWSGEDLNDDAHDELMQSMREDHADLTRRDSAIERVFAALDLSERRIVGGRAGQRLSNAIARPA